MLPMQTKRIRFIKCRDARRAGRRAGSTACAASRAPASSAACAIAGPDAEEAGGERVARAGGVDHLVDRAPRGRDRRLEPVAPARAVARRA